MLTLVIVVLFSTAIIGAPIAIRRGARAASFGRPPQGMDRGDASSVVRHSARINRDGRRFGPGIYEVIFWDGTLGVSIRRDIGAPTSAMGTYFYPAWWFRPSDVTVSMGTTRVLWHTRSEQAVHLHYQQRGERHVIEVVPSDRDAFIQGLQAAGFI
jgi:hypothetical protein